MLLKSKYYIYFCSMNLANIAEGWAKHLGAMEIPEAQKSVARQRVETCIACPYSKEQWLNKFIDGILKKDVAGSGIGCSICGCPINQKALALDETCPKNKW